MQALGLWFVCDQNWGSKYALKMILGVTDSVCGLFIRISRRILAKLLISNKIAQIEMSIKEKYEQYKKAVSDK